MRKVIIIAPGLAGSPTEESVLRKDQVEFKKLALDSHVFRTTSIPHRQTPEIAYFGLDPDRYSVAPGPLIISALQVDPPERSVHFYLSLLSLDEDGTVHHPQYSIHKPMLRSVMDDLSRLNTKQFKIVEGEGFDHGLVWEEGSLDLHTTPVKEVEGKLYRNYLPEGDGERMLRRMIDDSVNLLDTHPMNHIRREEGLPPINMIWPWGQGFREHFPNLALRRGEMVWVKSPSLRVAGLARLLGYRHNKREFFSRDLNVNFDEITRGILSQSTSILIFDHFLKLNRAYQLDKIEWLYREIGENLIHPLLAYAEKELLQLLVLCPTIDQEAHEGLGLHFDSLHRINSKIPYDERILGDQRVPKKIVWEEIDRFLG